MKLSKNYLLQALVFIVAVVGMNSCSCNKETTVEDKIKHLVSDDVDVVITGDVARMLNATEVKVEDGTLVLPNYMTEMIANGSGKRAVGEIEDVLNDFKGIDYTNALFAARFNDGDPDILLAFNVTDADEFYNSLSNIDDLENEIDTEDEGDYKVITYRNRAAVLIKDGLATVVLKRGNPLKPEKAVDELEKWIEKAESKPLADWKLNYLKEPAVASAWFGFGDILKNKLSGRETDEIQQYYETIGGKGRITDMSLGARFDLEGNSAKISATIFDNSGSALSIPFAGKFDTNLLDYTTANDYFAAGIAVNDGTLSMLRKALREQFNNQANEYRRIANEYSYDSYMYQYYMEQASAQRVAGESIMTLAEAVDGNVMIAGGTQPGVTIADLSWQNACNTHFVVAFNSKAGKARDAFNIICTALDQINPTDSIVRTDYGSSYSKDIPVNRRYNYNTYTYENTYMTINAKLDGNTIIISNASIVNGGGPNFDRDLFANNFIAAQYNVPKDSELLEKYDLPCGFASTFQIGDTAEGTLTLSLPGTQQFFIPAIFKIVLACLN